MSDEGAHEASRGCWIPWNGAAGGHKLSDVREHSLGPLGELVIAEPFFSLIHLFKVFCVCVCVCVCARARARARDLTCA